MKHVLFGGDGGDPDSTGDRYALQARYLALTRVELPSLAALENWAVREDHCFMRIILDHLFQGCWYEHLDRRLRAYKQLDDAQLRRAVAMGERMLEEGEGLVLRMNTKSLAWRGKAWD
ncbi:hypothetical protein [Mucisphaera sp.]|uniref:hypothetical protein n=1 Tax=Mucisphaera sp. TaxID=2913024 RepID=UPI003D0EC0DB